MRRAIVELGRGVGRHHPDFITCRRQLPARGKPPLVALIAVSRRTHRLAFAWPSSRLFWTVSDAMNRWLLWIVTTTVAAVGTGTVIGSLRGECR